MYLLINSKSQNVISSGRSFLCFSYITAMSHDFFWPALRWDVVLRERLILDIICLDKIWFMQNESLVILEEDDFLIC